MLAYGTISITSNKDSPFTRSWSTIDLVYLNLLRHQSCETPYEPVRGYPGIGVTVIHRALPIRVKCPEYCMQYFVYDQLPVGPP